MSGSACLSPAALTLGTSLAAVYTVPNNSDDAITWTYCNTTSVPITYYAGISLDGGATTKFLVNGKQIAANDTIYLMEGAKFPAGVQLMGRAGNASSIDSLVWGAQRSTQ